jgi:hypothetical protein
MRRCAWCSRVLIESEWRLLGGDTEEDVVAHLHARITHTICPACVERLRELGLSR